MAAKQSLYSVAEDGSMGRAARKPAFSKKEVGERLRRLREARDTTQVELAKLLGVTQSNVSEMERGIRTVTSNLAVKLANVLRVSVDEILMGSNGTAEKTPLSTVKLLRRIQKIEKLPEARQRVVLRFIDALIDQETDRAGR
jgi:transcriptional regulator with XRE-family HTH domain